MDLDQIAKSIEAHRPTLQGAKGHYAVLVPLVERDDGYHLLYEVRSSSLHHQPNEVCFPGGRMEEGETPEECALRETAEELGIGPAGIRVIGALDYLIRGGTIIYPYLAAVSREAERDIRTNPDEVSSLFTVPLAWLRGHPPAYYRYSCSPSFEGFPYESVGVSPDYPWLPLEMEVPVYQGLPHPLWGMTARITAHLIETICAEEDSR